jgi:hypothetical protein
MNNSSEDPQNSNNNGNDGFIWSQRLTIITGTVLALVLAAAHFAPALTAPLEWLPH